MPEKLDQQGTPLGENEHYAAAFKLMDYHQQCMVDRRSLGIKVFIGVLVLYFALISGANEVIDNVAEGNLDDFRFLLRMVFTVVCVLFIVFMFALEHVNKYDRIRYRSIDNHLWLVVKEETSKGVEEIQEGVLKTLWISWGGLWPALAVVFLTYAFVKFVGYLEP